jgi:hypothetical protein
MIDLSASQVDREAQNLMNSRNLQGISTFACVATGKSSAELRRSSIAN